MPALTITQHGGTAVLTLDLPGEPVNKLSAQVKTEFEAAFARLKSDPAVQAVVVISGKADNFIAGADLEEIKGFSTREEFTRLAREGQEMLQMVDDFPKPVIAAINGACLGGGLELTLACDWRVATDHPKTQLGLPEVQVGLLPGAGGCQRLPRLIGLTAALGIILPGKSEPGLKAFKLGMVDELVPKSILLETALKAADRMSRQGMPWRRPITRPTDGRCVRPEPVGAVRVLEGAEDAQKTGATIARRGARGDRGRLEQDGPGSPG
jgi:3-hydroxyacyl-CoA dehydrogenase/enoyl-CoA hydratase/3-hydroxybutyryl-CoA epimerase